MKKTRLVVWLATLAGAAGGIAAQTPGPTAVPTPLPTPWVVGAPEILINATATGNQKAPSVAAGADHGFVVAWTSEAQDGSSDNVFARRFDSAGVPIGGEFQVNTTTSSLQNDAAVASDSAGNFVVVWTSYTDAGGGSDAFARRFDSGGAPLGGEFRVNTYTTAYQLQPRIAMNQDGFVVVWTSTPFVLQPGQDGDQGGIYAQRYSVNGVPFGGEFRVNTYTTASQRAPTIGMDGLGRFMVVWESDGQDGDLGGIFGQEFDASAVPVGGEIPINTFTTGDQFLPDVAYTGDFAVVWTGTEQGGSSTDVFTRVFGNEAPEVRVNTHTTGSQAVARVGLDLSYPRRGYVVVWESVGQDDPTDTGSAGVFAQRFRNAPFQSDQFTLTQPARRGPEYRINTTTAGNQAAPALAMRPDGSFVVAWESEGLDGSGTAVVARPFHFPQAAPMTVDQSPSAGTSNLNGVLEAGERVIANPSWRHPEPGAAPLPLTGSAANLIVPPGPVYTIHDPNADYGMITADATNDCVSATGNCYELEVSGSRPAAHWDATFDENPASSTPIGSSLTKTWALHVGGSFNDVPQDAFYPFIENLFHNRITAGGACGADSYCGEEGVLRKQMAVFLMKIAFGPDFVPAPATGTVFADVPAADPFAPWIEELERQQVTGGCTAPPPPALPTFCPDAVVNRQQMAVFLIKTLWGQNIFGDSCSGYFEDVPCPGPFAGYIEVLHAFGIAAGCQANPPLFCPTDQTKRKQMAAFLVKTFKLNLYGPD